eukprot:1150446-Pelagomonas_calceolata.AAC.3
MPGPYCNLTGKQSSRAGVGLGWCWPRVVLNSLSSHSPYRQEYRPNAATDDSEDSEESADKGLGEDEVRRELYCLFLIPVQRLACGMGRGGF